MILLPLMEHYTIKTYIIRYHLLPDSTDWKICYQNKYTFCIYKVHMISFQTFSYGTFIDSTHMKL